MYASSWNIFDCIVLFCIVALCHQVSLRCTPKTWTVVFAVSGAEAFWHWVTLKLCLVIFASDSLISQTISGEQWLRQTSSSGHRLSCEQGLRQTYCQAIGLVVNSGWDKHLAQAIGWVVNSDWDKHLAQAIGWVVSSDWDKHLAQAIGWVVNSDWDRHLAPAISGEQWLRQTPSQDISGVLLPR